MPDIISRFFVTAGMGLASLFGKDAKTENVSVASEYISVTPRPQQALTMVYLVNTRYSTPVDSFLTHCNVTEIIEDFNRLNAIKSCDPVLLPDTSGKWRAIDGQLVLRPIIVTPQ